MGICDSDSLLAEVGVAKPLSMKWPLQSALLVLDNFDSSSIIPKVLESEREMAAQAASNLKKLSTASI